MSLWNNIGRNLFGSRKEISMVYRISIEEVVKELNIRGQLKSFVYDDKRKEIVVEVEK